MKSTFKYLLCAFLCGLAILSGCKKDDTKYTLTVVTEDSDMGSVTGSGKYKEGTSVTIEAVANSGYHFVKWNDGNKDNPRSVTVLDDATYMAKFAVGEGGSGEGEGEGDPSDAQTLSGSMSENRTLKDLGLPIDYIIDGRFDVDGNACLTIEPGVTIAFTGETGEIYVGENAGLKMVGTAEKPIVFTGPVNNPNKGSWGYIEYQSKRSDNQMKYVVMNNGGSRSAVLYLNDAKISIDNCTINGALENGIEANNSEITSFTNNTIKNCGESPFVAEILTPFANLGDGNKYEDNGVNKLKVTSGINVADLKGKQFTLKVQDIPYLFEGNINVDDASEFIVEPGVTINMAAGNYIETTDNSTLTMEGTSEKPIVMKSASDKEYHRGIWIQNETTASIKNVKISKTKEDQAVYIAGSYTNVTLENVEISDCRDYGVYFDNERDENMKFSQKNVTFKNCKKGNVRHNAADEVVDTFAYSYPMPDPDE